MLKSLKTPLIPGRSRLCAGSDLQLMPFGWTRPYWSGTYAGTCAGSKQDTADNGSPKSEECLLAAKTAEECLQCGQLVSTPR